MRVDGISSDSEARIRQAKRHQPSPDRSVPVSRGRPRALRATARRVGCLRAAKLEQSQRVANFVAWWKFGNRGVVFDRTAVAAIVAPPAPAARFALRGDEHARGRGAD